MKQIFMVLCILIVISTTSGRNVNAQQTKTAEPVQTILSDNKKGAKNYEELIDRYFESLNETDAKRRSALINQVWTETGIFAYPGQEVKGFAEIDRDVEQVQKKYPGAIVCRESKIEVVHDNYIRFTWEFGKPGEKPIITGVDFAVIVDGKLQLVVGFFDFMAETTTK